MARKSLIGISLIAGIASLVLLTSYEEKPTFSLPVTTTSTVAQRKEPELESIAKAITVKVHVGADRGSGIIFAKNDHTYTVVTNAHVAQRGENYRIETSDGVEHPATIIKIEGTDTGNDLAVFQFNSSKAYQVAKIGDSNNITEGEAVTAAGFPFDANNLLITIGKISLISDKSLLGGYQIGFTNETTQGMSGGVLLNSGGEVIGVLGKGKAAILDTAYVYTDGTTPTAETRSRMQQASFSIPIAKVAEVAPQLASIIPSTTDAVAQTPVNKSEYTGIVKTVDDIAENITVRIATPDNPALGSGVLVAKQGNRYYVATAKHNFDENLPGYQIVTPDGESYNLDKQTVEKSSAYDLAICSFESEKNYEVAKIGNYPVGANSAQVVFLSGFPKFGDSPQPQRMITGGVAASEVEKDFLTKDTYSLQSNGEGMLYTNISYVGMSGGAVLDLQGRLVGIHTGTDGEYFNDEDGNYQELNLGLSLGVPIQDFVGYLQTSQSALKPQGLDLATDPAPEITQSDANSIRSQLLTVTQPDKNADLVTWMNYGNQQWRYRKSDEAIAAFKKAIEIEPNFDRAYYAIGLAYGFQKDYQQAIDALKKATELNSTPYYYWRNLGLTYRDLEQYDSALAAYEQALKNSQSQEEQDFRLYVEKGDVLSELGRNEEAIASYTKALSINHNHPWAYNNRGNTYNDLQQYERAIADFNKAIEINPQNANAYNNRGNTYSILQQFESAIADLNKAIEINPQYASAYYNRGIIYNDLQKYESAIANYNKAIEINPNYANAYYNRGNTYASLQQFESAIADYSKAIEINPNLADAYINRGNTYNDLQKYESASADYNKAIEINPQLAEAYLNRGNTYSLLQQYESAIADYSKAIEINPQYAGAYNNRGATYNDLQQYQSAIADYSKAIEINPRYADAYINRGNTYTDLQQFESAIADYSKAIEINPHFASAYNNRGLTYDDLQQFESAIADYSKAIEINPRYADAYINRGNTYTDLQQFESAIADYSKAIEINPRYADAYINRGNTYTDLQQFESAIADYSKAIEINPRYADAYINRGNTYTDLQQFESAIADYSKAIEINPHFASAYNNRGLTYDDLQQFESAIADFNKAIEINPQYANAYNNRGVTYKDLEQFESAIADYSKAIEINPQLAEAYNNRGNTYRVLQQYQSAIANFNKAIEINPNYAEAYTNRGFTYGSLQQFPQVLADFNKAIEINPSWQKLIRVAVLPTCFWTIENRLKKI